MNSRRIKKATYQCRHLLPSGKFYYNIYLGKDGLYFSDPETFNCESVEELKQMLTDKPNITMNGKEHFDRMQECQANLAQLHKQKEQ